MRFTTFGAAALVALGLVWVDTVADEPPLHTEKGLRNQITVEETVARQYLLDRAKGGENPPPVLDAKGRPIIMGRYEYNRLIFEHPGVGGILHGSQVSYNSRHVLDDFQCLTAMNPWENIACLGAIHSFDIRQEPLTYHHRTGPIGAVYHELRTRKGGADAKAPVAVLGLTAGTQACYALRGQKMTFYECDPSLVKLVAETDKYFSYVTDARKRGAEIEIRIGDRRARLHDDKDRKYALVVVDLAESFPFCIDTFTKEAVQEYFDRLTPDGILALHISNKYLRFEPMFAAMADELKLTARVWSDAQQTYHGKTASSWVVLVRNRAHSR